MHSHQKIITSKSVKNNLSYDFYCHALAHDENQMAIFVDEKLWSYQEFANHVSKLAGWMKTHFPEGGQNIGILANRSTEAYLGLLAALWSGNCYVPLNPKLPISYLQAIIQKAELACLIVDPKAFTLLNQLRSNNHSNIPYVSYFQKIDNTRGFKVIEPEDVNKCRKLHRPVAVNKNQTAYIMFTSGTSGQPKGVAPTVANVHWFLQASQERYQLTKNDRFSQFNDLPWDPSVFDLFSAWKAGASCYVVPEQQMFAPSHFIRKKALTVWYSGPVQIHHLDQMRQLKPGSLPSLRLSLFVGEPLLIETANRWQRAACNSLVENVYGPTETTVVCMGQSLSSDTSCITPQRNYMAIGTPYKKAKVRIIGENHKELPHGKTGEIAIAGPMVTPGYWKDPELTRKNFVCLPETGERCYLTGDLGYRTQTGIFHFMGRKDYQLQINGVRVEPEEVEFHLRSLCNTDEVAVIGWPEEKGLVSGLAAFISSNELEKKQIQKELAKRLPQEMVPKTINFLEKLPRNQNHKIDRNALKLQLDSTVTS